MAILRFLHFYRDIDIKCTVDMKQKIIYYSTTVKLGKVAVSAVYVLVCLHSPL